MTTTHNDPGKFDCVDCGIPSQIRAVHRVNPKGEPGRFRCGRCIEINKILVGRLQDLGLLVAFIYDDLDDASPADVVKVCKEYYGAASGDSLPSEPPTTA